MYQTLYRKYRPNTFDKVVGQDVIVKTLKNAVIKNKISHAYLFEGPRGTGKTSIAKIFAKTVNCENLRDGIPCGECTSCKQINEGNPMDIIEMDAASSNSVEDIRDLISKTNVIPYSSKYKIYIIDEVHMLSQGAENALLKTLEEPPKHVIFILATTDPQKLLSTIISRCQVFEFKKISNDHIKNNLKYICDSENIGINDEALYTIARLADGGMRDAISILDQVIAYKENDITALDVHKINGTITQEELKDLINAILTNDIEYIYQKIDEYENSGVNLIKLLDEVIVFFNNVLINKYAKEYAKKHNIESDLYSDFENVSKDKLSEYILSYTECMNKMRTSSNPKLILELEFIKSVNELKTNVNNMEIEKSTNKVASSAKQISSQIEQKQDTKINYDLFNLLKKVRTNNSLYYISKQEIINTKNVLKKLQDYMLESKYNKLQELVLDGNIKAVGNMYSIFVYENDADSKMFNDNILKIQEMLMELIGLELKPIALTLDEWEPIKVRFNNKEKFELLNDKIDLNEIYDDSNNDPIKKMFGHLIGKEEE